MDFSLREEEPSTLTPKSTTVQIASREKWEHSNKVCLMVLKYTTRKCTWFNLMALLKKEKSICRLKKSNYGLRQASKQGIWNLARWSLLLASRKMSQTNAFTWRLVRVISSFLSYMLMIFFLLLSKQTHPFLSYLYLHYWFSLCTIISHTSDTFSILHILFYIICNIRTCMYHFILHTHRTKNFLAIIIVSG